MFPVQGCNSLKGRLSGCEAVSQESQFSCGHSGRDMQQIQSKGISYRRDRETSSKSSRSGKAAVSYSLALGSSTILMCVLFMAFHLTDPSALPTAMGIIKAPQTFPRVCDTKRQTLLLSISLVQHQFVGIGVCLGLCPLSASENV